MFRIMGDEKFSEARQHREKVRDERRGGCRNQVETLRGNAMVILMVFQSLQLDSHSRR